MILLISNLLWLLYPELFILIPQTIKKGCFLNTIFKKTTSKPYEYNVPIFTYIVSYLNNTNKIDYDTLKRDVKNNLEIYLREGVSIFKYLSIKHKFIYIMLKFHIYHLIKIYCQ